MEADLIAFALNAGPLGVVVLLVLNFLRPVRAAVVDFLKSKTEKAE